MCGISGFLTNNIKGPHREIAEVLVRTLNHRGPDGHGIWQDDSIVLVQNRLSIIDLSEAGSQPMISHDGNYVVSFNGEIYNYKDLQKKYLPQTIFKGHSDTEVLLELLANRGISIISELNGMFAFALWDRKNQRLLLARDHMGIKPLYYYYKDGKLIFASEIKAILSVLGYTPPIEPEAMENYFTFCHAIAPRTIYQNIFKLPHAHYAVILPDISLEIRQYWSVLDLPRHNGKALEIYQQEREADRLLDASVKRQLIADVDVGVFLSGGIDSSALVAYATRHYSGKLKTFSVGFEFEGYNELADSRIIADAFGTEHHEIRLSDVDLIPIIEKLVYHYDEPFGDAAAFPTYLLSEFARRFVKVALSGEGGDEIFGGYNRYVADRQLDRLQKIPGVMFASSLLKPVLNRLPNMRRFKKLIDSVPLSKPYVRYGELLTFFSEKELTALLNRRLLHSPVEEAYAALYATYTAAQKGNEEDIVNWLLYADQNRWMVETYLEKLDKASMAISLESRVPLLDIELVSFMSTVTGSNKIQGFRKKALLRNVLKTMIPETILNKPKHGFSVPTNMWFKDKLLPYVMDTIISAEKDLSPILNFKSIYLMIKEHKKGSACHDSQIWLVLMFCLWYKRFKPSN
jgi:asparagine synthase (glutamine-hydrolysing)